jgi:hypothetical protein
MPVLFTIQDDAQDLVPQSPKLYVDDVSTDPTMLPGPNVIPPAQYPTSAQSMHMSRRQRWYSFRAAMGEATFEMGSSQPPVIMGWDLDSEQQLNFRLSPNPPVTDHLSDESVELITLPPLAEIETEEVASNQIPRPEYYKDHLADENIEKITAAPALTSIVFWDNDAENQIPTLPLVSNLASDSGQDTTNFIVIPLIAHDYEVNQLRNDQNYGDRHYDIGQDWTQLIIVQVFNPALVSQGTDAENQLPNDSNVNNIASDQGQEWTQLIIVPAFNPAIVFQGTDAENQKSNDSNVNNIASDIGLFTQFIITPFIAPEELNIRTPDWSIDVEEERQGVPFIVLPFNDFSTDAENQIWNFAWTVDYQGWEYNDLLQEIVPTIFPVLIFYKLTSKPMLTIGELISTATAMSIASVKNVMGLSFSSVYNELAG